MAKASGRSSSGGKGGGRRVPPIKAPARNVKGIGKLGAFEGGLTPTVIDPKFGPNSGLLNGNIIGKQGK